MCGDTSATSPSGSAPHRRRLVGYLILHVHTIHDLQNPEKFDEALKLFSTPIFKLAEIGLLATVILTPSMVSA